MNSVFPPNTTGPYCLRSTNAVARKAVHSTKHGLRTISYIGSRLWESLPESIRTLPDEASFRSALDGLETLNCRCRLCAAYIPNLGFVD